MFCGGLKFPNFFVGSLCARNCIPTIKLLAVPKTAKLEFIWRIFGINNCSLEVYRGALRVSNFFVASLCVKNCIPAIKLLVIAKAVKLEFLFVFSE